MFPVILTKHFHGPAFPPDTRPTLERFDDAALIPVMRKICDARPAARQSSSSAGSAMIRAMSAYQAALLNTCMQNDSEEADAYLLARAERQDTIPAELAVLRSTKKAELHLAFEAMLGTGQDFLFAHRHPVLHRIFG